MPELLLAYAAGLLTLINPCVLPVLPIVLASSLGADRRGPLALAAGMSASFVAAGVLVTAFGRAIGLTPELLADIGAVMMLGFGLILLVPAFAGRFELATAGLAVRADTTAGRVGPAGLRGQFLGGLLLGAVWSPCIGPTLGSAIALASSGEGLGRATLIMVAFAAGVSTLIIGLGLGARGAIGQRTRALRGLAARSKPILGVTFVAVGLMLLFRVHHMIEAWAVENLPAWLIDLSVSL
jgi:cytochrome c biogenesis protein CcdA